MARTNPKIGSDNRFESRDDFVFAQRSTPSAREGSEDMGFVGDGGTNS